MTALPNHARPIYLVACVSQKGDCRARAADLYRSDWFRKARLYVEHTGAPWYILSAAHGLVRPTQHLDPYDATLHDITVAQRRLWGERTARQLCREIGPDHAGPIVFLAGRLYRGPLLPFAGERAVVPMLGMGIGQQKAWLLSQVADPGMPRASAPQSNLPAEERPRCR